MKSLAFSLQKGGTSKSSCTGNVGYELSQNHKVCLIDCDVQGNLSSWLIQNSGVQHELVDVLQGDTEITKSLLYLTDNLAIIPTFTGSKKLATYKETALFQEPLILDDMTKELEKLGFDFVLFDTAPGLSQMERSVAFAVDEIIAVLRPEYFSYDGLEIFEQFVQSVDKAYRKDPPTIQRKMILSMFNASFHNHQVNRDRAEKLDYELFLIPQDVAVEKAQEQHLPLFEYDPKSRAVEAYRQIAEALSNGTE